MYSPFVLSLYDQEQPFLDEIRAWETLAVDVDQKALMARNGLEARIKIADLLYQQVMGEYSLPTEKYAQLLTSTFDEFKGLLHTVDRVFEAEKCVMAQLAGSKASREHLLGLVCEAASNDDPAFMGLVEQLADGFHILKREFYRVADTWNALIVQLGLLHGRVACLESAIAFYAERIRQTTSL